MEEKLGEIKAILKKYGQEHLLNSYDKLAQAEIEFQKYGRLSGKTMLDLLSSNIMYASVLDVTGEKITLQKDAQQKMLALQLASIKAQIQEAITEKELAIQKNNTTIKTLDAVGASGVVIEQSDSVIEALNNQAKAYASTAQAAAAMYQAVQGNIEEAQSLLKEQNWAEDTQIGNVESTTSSVYYTQAEAKAEAERLRQENARYESELEGLKSTYEALGGDEGTIDVSEFMWWYDPGQMEEYNDALSNASDAEEELMTNLERLQKFRDLIRSLTDKLVKDAYRIRIVSSYMRRGREYQVVSKINEELDSLYRLIMSEQKNHIAIANKVMRLKGLVLDLMS